jgi:hypothetical protein
MSKLSKEKLAHFRCNDCGVNVVEIGDWYMATPEIWKEQLGLGWNDNLCIACLEQQLGRRVRRGDIGPASSMHFVDDISDRVADRLSFVTPAGNESPPNPTATQARKALVETQ